MSNELIIRILCKAKTTTTTLPFPQPINYSLCFTDKPDAVKFGMLAGSIVQSHKVHDFIEPLNKEGTRFRLRVNDYLSSSGLGQLVSLAAPGTTDTTGEFSEARFVLQSNSQSANLTIVRDKTTQIWQLAGGGNVVNVTDEGVEAEGGGGAGLKNIEQLKESTPSKTTAKIYGGEITFVAGSRLPFKGAIDKITSVFYRAQPHGDAHGGLDIGENLVPVHAICNGKIHKQTTPKEKMVKTDSGCTESCDESKGQTNKLSTGNAFYIQCDDDFRFSDMNETFKLVYVYMHLAKEEFTKKTTGQSVKVGEKVGLVDHTGYSGGKHLHITAWSETQSGWYSGRTKAGNPTANNIPINCISFTKRTVDKACYDKYFYLEGKSNAW